MDEDKECMVQQLGINATSNLGKYLRFPLRHRGRNRNEFQFVMDRVQSKLPGWKAKCLSLAGRLVFIKAAVTPVVDYYMQCCKILARICDKVDKLTRDFL